MTVAELRLILAELPADADVYVGPTLADMSVEVVGDDYVVLHGETA
jgi:hypothetical protein